MSEAERMTVGYTGQPVDTSKECPYSLFNLLMEEEQPIPAPVVVVKKSIQPAMAITLAIIVAMIICCF